MEIYIKGNRMEKVKDLILYQVATDRNLLVARPKFNNKGKRNTLCW